MIRCLILTSLALSLLGAAAPDPPPDPAAAPQFTYHLTARPWKAEDVPPVAYFDVAEPVARAMQKLQNASGQIIDPYEKREVQYSTAYFAYGVAVLVNAGHGAELLDSGVAAMDAATEQFSRGAKAIDNQAGEFVMAPLTEAIAQYAAHVPAEKVATWKKRMSRPLEGAIRNHPNNWQTYAMRGEWLRAKYNFATKDNATKFIEAAWNGGQARRIENDPWGLYHDESSDPDTLAVDAVGRINLMGLLQAGYDGPSEPSMRKALLTGAQSGLFLQDPTGQAPGGGRSSGHVWNDLVTMISDAQLAQDLFKHDPEAAGRCQRAADLALLSLKRWQRADGTFWITKNRFDHADRIGYSQASFFTNYNCAILFHLAELYSGRRNQPGIIERPAPAEVGGYVLKTDPAFAAIVANAGGLQLQGFLRGAVQVEKNQFWTTLGITRFSRSGWDSRLGNIEATRDTKTRHGVSFAPTFRENGKWIRLSDVPERYQGHLTVDFASPTLARFTIDYTPVTGQSGPAFRHSFIATPDGIFTTLTADGVRPGELGVTLPLLEDDGTGNTCRTALDGIATSRFADHSDQLTYLALTADGTLDAAATLDISDPPIQAGYGTIRPIRCLPSQPGGSVFIYPRSKEDPVATELAASFRRTGDGFASALGRVAGNIYVGKRAAGGIADAIQLNDAEHTKVTFNRTIGFILQIDEGGNIGAIESDREASANIGGTMFALKPYSPVILRQSKSP